MRHAAGRLEPVIYFYNDRGRVMLPPDPTIATPEGWCRGHAETLAEVDALQKRLEQQERDELEKNFELDEMKWTQRREQVRSNLYNRMVSSECSEYEKEFIRYYLMLREEKRAKHRQRFLEYQMYFEARNYDHPRTPEEILKESL